MRSFIFPLYLLFAVVVFPACSQVGQELEPAAFRDKIKTTKGALVLDVRTPSEFAEGHLADAVNIDVKASDFEKKSAALDKKRPVFVYCLAGVRSHRAAVSLRERGYQVIELKGGITAWQEKKLPVVR